MTTTSSILGQDPEENYDLFVERVSASGQVWGLKAEDGWAVCPSIEFEDTDVFPFWSDEADAAIHCVDEWDIYTPAPITLADFLGDWLPGMHEDNAMAGPNWDNEMTGLEIEPKDLAERLEVDHASES
ncbi:MAG: DUF2750 domain-containing protein [Pseudomonadales bacterium]|nr:DUF2750 domain-containing protein [Pseudomonadales bacterium]